MTVTDPQRGQHERALDAFRARRRGAVVLDILHDTLLDGPLPGRPEDGAHRVLSFGRGDLRLTVVVRYPAAGDEPVGPTELLLEDVPAGASVELLTEDSGPRLVESGKGALRLNAFRTTPSSVLLTLADGRQAQTAWLVF